jgi:hypothetical protein
MNEGVEPIHHLSARPPLARRPTINAIAPLHGAEVLGDNVKHVAQAPLLADNGEVRPAGCVLEVVVHDAAAPLLGHELLPPPHELRAVLPRHPSEQTPRRTRTPSPGHYADEVAFRDEPISVSEKRSWKGGRSGSGSQGRKGTSKRTFRLSRKGKGGGSGGRGFLGTPGRGGGSLGLHRDLGALLEPEGIQAAQESAHGTGGGRRQPCPLAGPSRRKPREFLQRLL